MSREREGERERERELNVLLSNYLNWFMYKMVSVSPNETTPFTSKEKHVKLGSHLFTVGRLCEIDISFKTEMTINKMN